MTNLNNINYGIAYPTNAFHYNKKRNVMSAFLSDLHSVKFDTHRIYKDACDEGFSLQSNTTGKVVAFAKSGEVRSGFPDNELQAEEFIAITGGADIEGKLKAVIWND